MATHTAHRTTANIVTDCPDDLARQLSAWYDVTSVEVQDDEVVVTFSDGIEQDTAAEAIYGAAHEIGATATIDDMGPARETILLAEEKALGLLAARGES